MAVHATNPPANLTCSRPVATGRSASIRAALVVSWLLLIGGLAGQEATWVHCHYMYRMVASTPDSFYRGLPLLVALAAGLAFVFLKHRWKPMPTGLSALAVLFAISTVSSLTLASIYCYSPKYLVGDFLRFSAPWLTLFLSYQSFLAIREHRGLAGLERWYNRLAIVAFFDAAMTIGFGLMYYGGHISNYFFMFLIGWVILRRSNDGVLVNVVLGLVLVATIASTKRTNFALTPLAILLAIWFQWARGGHVLRLCMTLIGVSAAALSAQVIFAQYSGNVDLVETCQRTFEKLYDVVLEGNHDRSYGLRMNEVRNLTAYFESHPGDLALGIGFGGEIPMRYETGNDTPSGNMHHVHKGYWLYLLRNGILGVVLLGGFVWVSTAGLLLAKSPRPLITASCAVYAVTRVVASFGGNLMMEDLDLPLVVGLGYAFADPGRRSGSRQLDSNRSRRLSGRAMARSTARSRRSIVGPVAEQALCR